MAAPGEIGWIGKSCPECGAALVTKIMRSAAGWFVGTQCKRCAQMDPSPNSRESHYYPSAEAVQQALDSGSVRWRDTAYHPGPMQVIIDGREQG